MNREYCSLIGIDWGTSRLRAFRIGNAGQILDRRRSDHGIARLAAGDFDPALRQIIGGWPSGAPILMCGMIGSRQGWREVPYRDCAASAKELATTLASVATSAGPAWIVGGLSTTAKEKDSQGRVIRVSYDVMRGEETLIIGAALPPGVTLVIAPGTHSKWAIIQGGHIERFRTCMTGELYELLRKHSILGRFIEGDHQGRYDEGAFREGVQVGLDEPAVLHSLFSVRTRALFEKKPRAALEAYLSGILIGSEVSGEAPRVSKEGPTFVIGRPELGRLYQVALAAAGFKDVRLMDAEAAVANGLWTLWQLRGAAS